MNDDLSKARKKIDQLDEIIMKHLNERFSIMEQIALYKRELQIPLVDKDREDKILDKASDYPFMQSIKKVYQQVFYESKLLQALQTFLVGKSLPYSYSEEIHNYFHNPFYQIVEVNSFQDFIDNYSFYGINVTNPYKKEAFKYAKTSSEIAKETQVANLLIKRNGIVHAENVDYDAFIEMLNYYEINVKDKTVIIVGNGATSNTVKLALKNLGARKIIKLVRNIRSNEEFSLGDYLKFKDYEILINTASYGVKPYYELKYLFPLHEFHNLEAVIDVNYNPLRTPLMQEAKHSIESLKKYVKIISGLYMLVAGARKSEEIWLGSDYFLPTSIKTTRHLNQEKVNIVLIGMPYTGKTTIGSKLAKLYRRPFIDTDNILELRHQAITDFTGQPDFPENFRQAECNIVRETMAHENHVIATGGGVIECPESMQLLSQTGLIVYLNTKLETLMSRFDGTRPLLKEKEDLETLYKKRHSLYLKYADIVVENESDYINEIMLKLHEYFVNQYPEK